VRHIECEPRLRARLSDRLEMHKTTTRVGHITSPRALTTSRLVYGSTICSCVCVGVNGNGGVRVKTILEQQKKKRYQFETF